MKKLLFAAAAVWLLAACNKELGPEYETPPVFDEVTFTTATQPGKITEPGILSRNSCALAIEAAIPPNPFVNTICAPSAFNRFRRSRLIVSGMVNIK